MKKYIKTLLRENLNIEEVYPPSFDMEYFKSLTSFNKRIKYCQEHLQRISSGSARIVYKIDDQKVLKLARNKKGIAQNEVEISASQDYYLDDIVANVFDFHPDDLWLEMELARKVTKNNFKKFTGYSFEDFSNVLNNDHYRNNPRRFTIDYLSNMDEETIEKIHNDDFYMTIFDYAQNYGIPPGDLTKTNSYGYIKRNGNDDIVLIDYGLDSNVFSTHYS